MMRRRSWARSSWSTSTPGRTSPPPGTPTTSPTVSYTDIYRIAKGVVEGPSRNLLESVAQSIAASTLLEFPRISAVRVKVGKPHVAVQGVVDYLGWRYSGADKREHKEPHTRSLSRFNLS
ncbi:hypothetical protein ZWY2020_051623 [Hordeum vulgare]|nr:hypothetical protein ZWY2020_051623 [Hordeum vulgare]